MEFLVLIFDSCLLGLRTGTKCREAEMCYILIYLKNSLQEGNHIQLCDKFDTRSLMRS